ncbi:MAG: hypothetical protein ACRC3Y_13825 [Romboutsia sp.]|uniref:hypothetical protein n=1 Tax=Romboutsia sp. TaxID=1965302 RepID=UPI003F3C633F
MNNDFLTLKNYILRCYPTPLNISSSNCCIEGILCLLKNAYFNNTPISLEVNDILDNIPSIDYSYVLSFDCNVLWLTTANEIYLISINQICGILKS